MLLIPNFNATAAWCGQAFPLVPCGHVQVPIVQPAVCSDVAVIPAGHMEFAWIFFIYGYCALTNRAT